MLACYLYNRLRVGVESTELGVVTLVLALVVFYFLRQLRYLLLVMDVIPYASVADEAYNDHAGNYYYDVFQKS